MMWRWAAPRRGLSTLDVVADGPNEHVVLTTSELLDGEPQSEVKLTMTVEQARALRDKLEWAIRSVEAYKVPAGKERP